MHSSIGFTPEWSPAELTFRAARWPQTRVWALYPRPTPDKSCRLTGHGFEPGSTWPVAR